MGGGGSGGRKRSYRGWFFCSGWCFFFLYIFFVFIFLKDVCIFMSQPRSEPPAGKQDISFWRETLLRKASKRGLQKKNKRRRLVSDMDYVCVCV